MPHDRSRNGAGAVEGLLWFALLTLATQPLSRWLTRAPLLLSALDRIIGGLLLWFVVQHALRRARRWACDALIFAMLSALPLELRPWLG